ncbi:hypothetical protein FA15DRAFT_686060 [Coprinopsis marcescibilis]|uniref:Coiled-coil domain-containing protein 174 n=1 Tax=Coprinopsis marcescibilis TaxID=230819 RepID=A0A5C3L2J2_COPMA|nr:hypothetical protein FA15DRAFT_686060 [Coprinopsis marcescibilis]
MSHNSKAKAKGISANSFFDLKSELSKQEAEFSKNKAAGKATTIVGGVKRPDKKPTVWARQNKGVSARATRDVELEAVSRPTLESARAVLERKAKIYEKLKKGKSGGLNEAQYNALLVDFDAAGPSLHYESDSDDADESLNVPKPPGNDDDPMVEYEDEFGRLRTSRRSEVPRHLLRGEDDEQDPVIEYEDEFGRMKSDKRSNVPRHLWPPEADPDADLIIHNPVNYFPVYEPTAERMEDIEKKFAESHNPLAAHYDASKEVRAKGAGFYQFSGDEETRKAQMEELRKTRVETEQARQEAGAVDIKLGEVEGMRDGESLKSTASKAMEKRKRELEERRKLIEAKRRKVTKPSEDTNSRGKGKVEAMESLSEPFSTPLDVPEDPFAVLEIQALSKKNSGKEREKLKDEPLNGADAFLARLEQEFLETRQKTK